ncbi:VWA domain-containing protein [Streptomyces sp. NPDC093982]|uniref:VWA domain-containing protein n=1 Tax=Streptomyces sp. NPDC093982 TaxID=3155077 RepID=UPI00342E38DB
MGILTLLRNAFGRSRKVRTAGAEGATAAPEPQPTLPSPSPEPTPPTTVQVPEPRTSEPPARPEKPETPDTTAESDDEHDLVSAAFDNVTVPRPAGPTEERATTGETPATDPTPTEEPAETEPTVAEKQVEAEPTVTEEPVAEQPVAEEPATEPVAAEEPVAEEPATEPVAAEEPVAETPAAEEPAAEPAEAEEPVAAEEPAPVEAAEEPVAKATETASETEPEPVAVEAEPEPVVAAAADGGEAPQGPLAADDESVTGGAGGNNEAEGEAEAETPVPTTLRTAHTAAAATLTKTNLTGTTAKLYLVLDRSASMRPYYKDGSAQALAEQTLALAAHLDPEATGPKVHVVFFSTELDGTGELTLTDHENKIDELHAGLGRMGRTSYHVAVEEVVAHHTRTAPGTPALVVFQTDGAPDAKTPATHALTEAAKNHPAVFFSFVAFGDPENKAFDYLRKLKLDNMSYFLAGEDPKELTDAEIYEGILAGWRP